jgi:hypothetical protein
MARDTNLLLHNAAVTSNSTSTAINIAGGTFAVVELLSTVTPTDADETLDVDFQVSLDGGSSFLTLFSFPQLTKAADIGNAGTHVAMACYIPRADANPDARDGTDTPVEARLNFTVGGTTPSYTIKAWVSHPSSVAYGSVAGFSSGTPGRYGPLDNLANFD